MAKVHIRIDKKHSLDLLAGKSIAIKAPEGAEVIELSLAADSLPPPDPSALLADVFFNGRRA
jgi:hypothetical protein